MRGNEPRSLWSALDHAATLERRWLWGTHHSLQLSQLAGGTCLDVALGALTGRSALILADDPLASAAALIELDGVARRLVLAPPDLLPEHLSYVISTAEIDSIVSDRYDLDPSLGTLARVMCHTAVVAGQVPRPSGVQTDWVLFTSGTTGLPKMVLHTLSSLAWAIRPGGPLSQQPAVWATFYDIRRFGGLQILLRAVLGGGSLVFPSPDEPITEFLARAGMHGATHITGTPSHWRRALMSPSAHHIAPQYVRLSGEIADQTVLDALRDCYPHARVAHAFAATEAGLAFEVNDGLSGFPATYCGAADSADVDMAVIDGTLRVRSRGTAHRYLGADPAVLLDSAGFVDTGDLVELSGDRYFFAGRRGGIINVGGLKVHPEEVEAVINRDPRVSMSLVRARRNPITGALVVADVVLTEASRADPQAELAAKVDILAECRRRLEAHKIPAVIRFVPSLPLTPAGKVARPDA